MPLPYAGASDIGKRCLRRSIYFFRWLTILPIAIGVEEASEPKRSELFKKHPPNETDASASVPNKPDALALLIPINSSSSLLLS